MSHHTVYFPRMIRASGKWKEWVPEMGHFIGNEALAKDDALKLRRELKITHPKATVRRFSGHINVYI